MQYIIGIDGGGTKTEAVALDNAGNERFHCLGDATNPSFLTPERVIHNLEKLLTVIFQHPSLANHSCTAVCMGLSGIVHERDKQLFIHFMEQYQKVHNLKFELLLKTDIEIVLKATLSTEFGIAVIAGTGSNVYGLTPARQHYHVGGWGHLLGDEGSGYEIGVRSLQAVMQSYDGVLPSTVLTEMILKSCSIEHIIELKDYIYQPHITKTDIARFAKLCIEATMHDDNVAKQIIISSATRLAHSTQVLIAKDKWFADSHLVMSGSIFQNSVLFRDAFTSVIHSRFKDIIFCPSRLQPVYGAVKLAEEFMYIKGE